MKDLELKIVMIGRSKAGKSASGNIILGRIAFKSCMSHCSVTQKCQLEKGQLEEDNLSVIDTPGLFGAFTSDSFDEEDPEEVMEKIKQCLLKAPPGPVVSLVVLQLGSFTEPEQQTVKIIQRSFGREAEHHTMALFTRGDDLKKEEVTIEKVIGADPALRDFIRECRGGYHVFDNGDKDAPQVTELLRKINAIVERNGEIGDTVPEDKKVLKKKKSGEEAGGGKSFVQALFGGAFAGACLGVTIGAVVQEGKIRWIDLKYSLLFGAVGGSVVGVANFGACKLVNSLMW